MDTQTLLSLSDDLHQVKGNISQIQATLNNVLARTPTNAKFEELAQQFNSPQTISNDNKTLFDRVHSLVNSPQLKVAVKLKTLFDGNKAHLLFILSKLNFKTLSDDDEDLAEFLNHTGSEVMNFSYTGEYPPPLPVIEDKALLLRVFTDKSFRQPSDYLDSVVQGTCFNGTAHNEKLYMQGRAFLDMVVMELLDERFPNIYPEELQVLSKKIVSDEVLAKVALGYGMVDAFKFNLSKTLSFEEKLRVFSKLFASYVSVVRNVYSFEYAKQFVAAVFKPIITAVKEQNPMDGLAKAEVDFLISQFPDFSLVYETVENEPFAVNLKINGEVMSTGTSSRSEEEAAERAALYLVENVIQLQKVMKLAEESYDTDKNISDGIKRQKISNSSDKTLQTSNKSSSNMPAAAPQPYPTPYGAPRAPSIPPPRGPQPLPYTNIAKPLSSLPKLPGSSASAASSQPPAPMSYNVVPGMANGPVNMPAVPVVDAAGVPIIGQSYKLGMESNAKNTLYALLGQQHLVPVYKTSRSGTDYHATVTVNDTIIGVGYDNNKRFASQKAAMSALGNDKALKSLGIELDKTKPEITDV